MYPFVSSLKVVSVGHTHLPDKHLSSKDCNCNCLVPPCQTNVEILCKQLPPDCCWFSLCRYGNQLSYFPSCTSTLHKLLHVLWIVFTSSEFWCKHCRFLVRQQVFIVSLMQNVAQCCTYVSGIVLYCPCQGFYANIVGFHSETSSILYGPSCSLSLIHLYILFVVGGQIFYFCRYQSGIRCVLFLLTNIVFVSIMKFVFVFVLLEIVHHLYLPIAVLFLCCNIVFLSIVKFVFVFVLLEIVFADHCFGVVPHDWLCVCFREHTFAYIDNLAQEHHLSRWLC